MSKIIKDTLQKPDGKWDKQALTMFTSFIITVILGIFNTFISYYTKTYSNPIAMGVFDTFAILTGSLSGINVGNKLVDLAKAKNQPQSPPPIDYINNTYTPPPDRTDG